MTMEDAIRSSVAQAVERFAAYMGTLPQAASWVPSFSPTNCDMISWIHAKARWLIRMLAWVRATLDDAEDMDITEESVRDWLRELQAVADAAEDVLDELPHEALRLGLMGMPLPHQVHSSSSVTPLHELSAFLSCVEQRMEDVVSRFMKIKKPEQALELDCCEEQEHAESISARPTTSSVIEEPRIVGRTEELAKIKQFLLLSPDAEESTRNNDMDDHVSVMAIVGMGGLGKTTLAQIAYSDSQVNQHFQLKSWVCVSEDFDVIRLTKAMLQSLNVEANGLSELDPLQQKLVHRLSRNERFLLVLDDVWDVKTHNSSNWNLLTAPLLNRSADSKIIITTRSSEIPEMVATNSTYDLSFLSDEDTLELFMLHAFEGRDPKLHQNLVAIGKEIAKRCGGVPLAAKTIGGLLHTKDDEEWNKILKSEVWNAAINQEGSIIPILRLSYLDLSAPLKRCFRYCSLFSKDSVFDRNQTIRMWMAQGYIKANRRELMEDVGQSTEGVESCPFPSHIRHLSIYPPIGSRMTGISAIKDISETKSFRSFLLPDPKCYLSIFERGLLSDSYTRIEHLRVLDLPSVRLDHLPEYIARLKHLRFLRISVSAKALPESVGSMYHLQTLDLGRVSELPNSMSNLHKLRHLILSSWDYVRYPVGIGKLTDLQTIRGFHVSPKHNHAKLGELRDMNSIRGEFAIKGLENLADVNEAKKACLEKKRNIWSLHLEWDDWASSSSIDDEVLESLKPSVKLESLQILGFKGPSFPSWLGDGSFSRLGTVKLEHCGNWTSLPPLGQLPSLRSLYISEARAVEYIGGEFFCGGFPQLEELTLVYLHNWKSWCGAGEGDCPKLKKLSIEWCGNLDSLSLINLGAVEDISIFECPKLQYMPGNSLEVWCVEAAHLSPAAPTEDEPHLQIDQDVGQ
ncbi:hypothetical protein Taro_051762 [Colocasia esculenta]|uniref:Disease resistance RPP13-like protein 1 n=1 Tax=Colocasia esculenta TaxID=4460 RepID=A0A843XI94_COLES|nr:hypothetical protein [Colocasia esculenta]